MKPWTKFSISWSISLQFRFLIQHSGIRVVSNAGGVNPHECAKALIAVAEEAQTDLKVAVVTGDDLMGDIEQIRQAGIKEMTSGQDFPDSVVSMNAYIG